MENTTDVKLIDGTFSPAGASEVLHAVLNDKINYHNRRINSISERSGGDTSFSENRIKELKAAKAQVADLIAQAKAAGCVLELHSNIEITFTKQKQEEVPSEELIMECF